MVQFSLTISGPFPVHWVRASRSRRGGTSDQTPPRQRVSFQVTGEKEERITEVWEVILPQAQNAIENDSGIPTQVVLVKERIQFSGDFDYRDGGTSCAQR